jgi:hypothetical protein
LGKRPLGPGERECAHPGCPVVLPAPTGPGRPPARCAAHRSARPHRKTEPKAPRLTVVRPTPPAGPPPPTDDVEAADPPAPAAAPSLAGLQPGGLAAAIRRDLENLFSSHPAADSLTALAVAYAQIFDHPLTQVDPRAAASVGHEIRATIGDLVKHEEAAEDDDLGGMPTPVGVPSA